MDAVPEHSDTELVASARDGDEEAFAELWRRHAAAGRTVARSFSTEDPDDVVAEAYLRILSAVREGKGPTAGFRPYLFTTIRNVAAAWGQRRREHPLEDATAIPDPSSTEAASMEALDRSLTVRAFRSLPERWQEVLWYTEVEQMTAAAVAPLLGLTPNGTAALAYRAREGLRQAWIQAHIAASPEGSEHRWTTERVGAYSRGGLGKRDTARIERHLAECAKCSIVAAEARNVGSRLTLVLLPLLLGVSGAAAYAATVREGAAATAAAAAYAKANAASSGASVAPGTSAARGARNLSTRAGRAGTVAGTTAAGFAVAAGIVGAIVLGPQLFASSRPGGGVAAPSTTTEPQAEVPDAPAAEQPAPPPAAPPVPAEPDTPTAPSVPPADDRPERPLPSPAQHTAPLPTAPVVTPTPPVTPPVPPPVPPAAPVLVSTFPAGSITADTTVPVAGTGVPGATVSVLAPGHATPLGTGTVAPDGSWSLTLDIAGLADGSWQLNTVQTTAAGTSAPATFAIAIDRTALAPVILDVDTGSGAEADRLAPVITGTAEPGATVELSDHGTVIATVTADDSGHWSSPELIRIPVDYAITARQTDRLGNVSPDTAPLTGTAVVPEVTASGSLGTVSIAVQGEPGTVVQVWADGKQSRYTLTLDAGGHADAVYSWTAGDHRIGVVAVYGARHGVLSDVPVTLP